MMKYESPVMEQIVMSNEDILTLSQQAEGSGNSMSFGDFFNVKVNQL